MVSSSPGIRATLVSLYPEEQQEAVARTLTLESEPIVKLLEKTPIGRLSGGSASTRPRVCGHAGVCRMQTLTR